MKRGGRGSGGAASDGGVQGVTKSTENNYYKQKGGFLCETDFKLLSQFNMK